MKRTEARIFACVFMALVGWPAMLGLAGIRGQAIENRRLTEAPSFALRRLADRAFYESLSDYLNDHLPLREAIVRTNSLMAVHLWRDSPNPEVHIGRGGWLFTASFRSTCPGRMPLSAVRRIAVLGRTLRDAHREMRFVLAPNKAVLYPERLGTFTPADFECGLERLVEARQMLSQAADVGFIDMWTHLSRLKASSEEPVYFPSDSHWTPRGATEMSRAIVDSIEPGLWSDASVAVKREILLPMDLAAMIGTPQSVPVSITESRRPGVTTRIIETEDCAQGPGCVVRYQSTSDHQKLINRPTLLVRDSFGTMAIDTVAPYFADITFLFWSANLEQQLAARLKDAELVIYETVDHFLWDRLERGLIRLTPTPTARPATSQLPTASPTPVSP